MSRNIFAALNMEPTEEEYKLHGGSGESRISRSRIYMHYIYMNRKKSISEARH
jgi:hypothetical protein